MGLTHIYCGDGKGKTTAALGLALRAAGSGMRVHFVQFLKGGKTSELESLQRIPNISVDRCDQNYGFTYQMSEENKQKLTACHNALLRGAETRMRGGEIDLLILDEFNAAYAYRLLDRALADRLVLDKPERIELVLTGREPQQKFLDAADYVSEIRAVKHPYRQGQGARRGIEF